LMMIPEPWVGDESMSPQLKAFYEYHAALMEPWDGPASIVFTDGRSIGAVLDRNGLRPSRYYVTRDQLVILASEVGVLDIPPEDFLQKTPPPPAHIFLADPAGARTVPDAKIKRDLAAAHQYHRWLAEHPAALEDLPRPPYLPPPSHETLLERQRVFGYTQED